MSADDTPAGSTPEPVLPPPVAEPEAPETTSSPPTPRSVSRGASLSRWIPKGPPGLTVLSLDGQWLKVLHVQGRTFARTVTALIAHRIEGMNEPDVLTWLQEAWASSHLEAGTVLIANPSHLTTTRVFTLPATDPAEIREIVELQAEKHTPYAKEEILTDFQIIDTDRSGYSRVLLVLSHQDVVYRALRLVEGMGWSLERVGFALEGLVNWFRVSRPQPSADGTLVVELDSEATNLVIVRDAKPYFHRSVAMGVTQVTAEAAEGYAKLVTELQRSIEAFDAEGLNMPVTEVVLTGQLAAMQGFEERLRQSLEIPVTVIPPFERCPIAAAAASAESNPAHQVAFASLAGLALSPGTIDLTPKALKLHRAFEVRTRAMVAVGCQVIGVFVLCSFLVMGKAHKQERYHATLLDELRVVSETAQAMGTTVEHLDVVKRWLEGRTQLLDAVTDLTQRTPQTILWTGLNFAKDEQLVLKGVSDDMPKVFEFVADLKKSVTCAQVESRRVNKKRVEDRDVTEFEIVCSLAWGTDHGQEAAAGS